MTTKTLFTTTVSHLERIARWDALDALTDALRVEFPAYRVASVEAGDFAAAVFVISVDAAAPVPAHLNGWGHGSLVLKLVA